jgi:hypothetical protein
MSLRCRMGQRGLLGSEAPAHYDADRRGVNTVIQQRSYRAARFIEHGPRIIPGLGANDRAATVFAPMAAPFAATPQRCRQATTKQAKVHPVPTRPSHRAQHGPPSPSTPAPAAMRRSGMQIAQSRHPPGASRCRDEGMRNECSHGRRELDEGYAGRSKWVTTSGFWLDRHGEVSDGGFARRLFARSLASRAMRVSRPTWARPDKAHGECPELAPARPRLAQSLREARAALLTGRQSTTGVRSVPGPSCAPLSRGAVTSG